jgi:hypothetical protein
MEVVRVRKNPKLKLIKWEFFEMMGELWAASVRTAEKGIARREDAKEGDEDARSGHVYDLARVIFTAAIEAQLNMKIPEGEGEDEYNKGPKPIEPKEIEEID